MKKSYLPMALVAVGIAVMPLGMSPLQGQGSSVAVDVEKSFVRKLGRTAPLRDVLPVTPTDALKLQDYKTNKPHYVRNFIGRRPGEGTAPWALPRGKDPLLNTVQTRDGGIIIEPRVVAEGLGFDDVSTGVPDPNGDVSDQYFIQTVNATWLQVYDLQGNKVGNKFHANTIWQQVGFNSAGDAIILFDKVAGRWFLTEFPPSSRVLLAISDNADPFGAWTAYALSTPQFPDYPKYGIWPNAYVLTTNENGGGTVKFYAIDRQGILNGEDTVDMQRFTIPRLPSPSFQVASPVTWIGDMAPPADMNPMIIRINDDGWGGVAQDRIEIYEMEIDWENEDNSIVTQHNLHPAPFDAEFCSEDGFGFTCVPQPNSVGIDGIPWVVMHKANYRKFDTHSALVLNFTVDVSGHDDGGIRWMELRRDENTDWTIYQEGTFGTDDGENRFMGGISIDSRGNIGLAYNVTSEKTWPSLRFTGRRASDPLGQMTIREFEFATGTGALGGDRFGDYASMSVDDQDMFWYTGEYVQEGGSWASKIVGFKLDRNAVDIGPVNLVTPVNAPDLDTEEVSFGVINHGTEPALEFVVGYVFEDGEPVVDTVQPGTPLMTDSIYIHTFEETISFSDFGDYALMVFTGMGTDTFLVNDTCHFTVSKLTRYDASVAGIDDLPQVFCDTVAELALILANIGTEPLSSVTIEWSVNGGPPEVFGWTGDLLRDETEIVPILVSGLMPGENLVEVHTSDPNALVDQNTLNDTLNIELTSTPGGERIVLNLLTDLYPDETTWELRDTADNVLFSAGPFFEEETVLTEEWCLDPDQCYRFVLFDSFGDGIEAYGVQGDFQIINEDGFVIAALNNSDFGDSTVTDFCLDFTCMLSANRFVAHEDEPGANNGLISVAANNGTPPITFSNDGGMNFQSSPIFSGLAPGEYEIVVRDGSGCELSFEVTILACETQVMTQITSASAADAADGSILILTAGASGHVEYSIDGGENFQDEPYFVGLLPGTYIVVVEDSVGCQVGDTVKVDFINSVAYTTKGHLIKVYPNPSDGYFLFEIHGLGHDLVVAYDILDGLGQIVQRGDAANYSGILKGAFSLYNQPAGIYYLRIRHPDIDRLVRAIKH